MAKVKTSGNAETMNLNNILYQNIIASPYFKSLYEKKTYHEVLDEIVRNVTTLEPFLKGTHASTAFCLLYKLWTLRLTIKQMTGILNHKDSPHVRALGLLYLRYVGDPSELWDWYVDYLDDETEVRAEGGVKAKVITIGKMCHMLLMEPKWSTMHHTKKNFKPREQMMIVIAVTTDIGEKLGGADLALPKNDIEGRTDPVLLGVPIRIIATATTAGSARPTADVPTTIGLLNGTVTTAVMENGTATTEGSMTGAKIIIANDRGINFHLVTLHLRCIYKLGSSCSRSRERQSRQISASRNWLIACLDPVGPGGTYVRTTGCRACDLK